MLIPLGEKLSQKFKVKMNASNDEVQKLTWSSECEEINGANSPPHSVDGGATPTLQVKLNTKVAQCRH